MPEAAWPTPSQHGASGFVDAADIVTEVCEGSWSRKTTTRMPHPLCFSRAEARFKSTRAKAAPMSTIKQDERLTEILELRLLVGYLGEKSQPAWWGSSFFGESAKQFLRPVFGRTALLAQYNGVREAARLVHDASVGVGSVFHLFRLPQEIEQDLHRRAEGLADGDSVMVNLRDKNVAVARLQSIAGAESAGAEGPVSIGSIGDLRKPTTLRRFASHYLKAFKRGTRVYPYLGG